jgi:hypothetical protein
MVAMGMALTYSTLWPTQPERNWNYRFNLSRSFPEVNEFLTKITSEKYQETAYYCTHRNV